MLALALALAPWWPCYSQPHLTASHPTLCMQMMSPSFLCSPHHLSPLLTPVWSGKWVSVTLHPHKCGLCFKLEWKLGLNMSGLPLLWQARASHNPRPTLHFKLELESLDGMPQDSVLCDDVPIIQMVHPGSASQEANQNGRRQ